MSVIEFVENAPNWSLKVKTRPGIVNVDGRNTVPGRVLESRKTAWLFVDTLNAIPNH